MPTKSKQSIYGGRGHQKLTSGRMVRSRSGAVASLLPMSRTNLNKVVVPPKTTGPAKAAPRLGKPAKKAPAPKKGPRSGKGKGTLAKKVKY